MSTTSTTRTITTDTAWAAELLAAGGVIAHAFGNFYVITTRADAATVTRVNLMKGRPPHQVGSITAPPEAIPRVWDFSRLPDGLTEDVVRRIINAFFERGPFGFRGPAAQHIPGHLTFPDGGITTTQVIAPGYACVSNAFLRAAVVASGDPYLYITSANRSRHQTGADDSPAHWRADGLRAEFGEHPRFVVVEHDDEDAARGRYPEYLPMSTTLIGFHRVLRVHGDPRPHLMLERHGSLHVDEVRSVLAGFGFGVVIGPKARTRLLLRDYTDRLSDREVRPGLTSARTLS